MILSVRQEPSSGPDSGTVLAAGAIVWRPGRSGRLELLVVRSARWNEWSWPKGKLKGRESPARCAVREVHEETGVRVELGVRLPSVSYLMPDGRPKEVTYWAGRPRRTGDPTAGTDEIDDSLWLPAEEALQRVRPSSRGPAQALLARAEDDALETTPLLVVRHAKARSRAHWEGGEATRPLTSTGERQARALARILGVWAPPRLLVSPWRRCLDTLRPYLAPQHRDAGTDLGAPEPEVLPLLSEEGLEHDRARVGALVTELIQGGDNALLCTHRPVLAEVVATLAEVSPVAVRDRLPHRNPWLSPAEVLVAHVAGRRSTGPGRRVVAVERHAPRP
jgi:8-oxo-(d)GTP phosphatase